MKHKNKIVTPDSPDDVKLPRKCSQMYENTRHDLMATRCAQIDLFVSETQKSRIDS